MLKINRGIEVMILVVMDPCISQVALTCVCDVLRHGYMWFGSLTSFLFGIEVDMGTMYEFNA